MEVSRQIFKRQLLEPAVATLRNEGQHPKTKFLSEGMPLFGTGQHCLELLAPWLPCVHRVARPEHLILGHILNLWIESVSCSRPWINGLLVKQEAGEGFERL